MTACPKLVELAKSDNAHAAREVPDRCLGKPQEADRIERMERFDALIGVRVGVLGPGEVAYLTVEVPMQRPDFPISA